MLANKKVTVVGDSVIECSKIATYGAIVSNDGSEITLTTRIIDTDAYEANQAAISADRTEIEAFAFTIQKALDTEA